jgi:hypothetical protein
MPRKPKPKAKINTKNHLNVDINVSKKKKSIKNTLGKITTKEAKINFLTLNINTYHCMNHKFISKEAEHKNTLIAKYCEKLLKEIK